MMPNKGIYMGSGSTAKLPVRGRVDSDREIVMGMIATGYDAANTIMLTRTPGRFQSTSKSEIRKRFSLLRSLAKKYAPHKVKLVDQFEHLALKRFDKKISIKEYLSRMAKLARENDGSDEMCRIAINHIDAAERMNKNSSFLFSPQFIPPQRSTPKTRRKPVRRPIVVKREKTIRNPMLYLKNPMLQMKNPMLHVKNPVLNGGSLFNPIPMQYSRKKSGNSKKQKRQQMPQMRIPKIDLMHPLGWKDNKQKRRKR